MAYFFFNFQGFPLFWAVSTKSFQWVSLPFFIFSFALGHSIRNNY